MYLSAITLLQLPLIDIGSWLGIGDFFRITSVGTMISAALGTVLIFASLAFMMYLAWASVRWLTAGGDKNQIAIAKDRISHALIGIAGPGELEAHLLHDVDHLCAFDELKDWLAVNEVSKSI